MVGRLQAADRLGAMVDLAGDDLACGLHLAPCWFVLGGLVQNHLGLRACSFS